MPVPRLPRFKRAPVSHPLHLTERDIEIIRLVARHRFLRSSQIVALLGGSAQQLLRRLNLLYHHGFLERPRAQLDYYHEGGSRYIVYGLGNKGGTFLQQERGVGHSRISWGEKNRAVGGRTPAGSTLARELNRARAFPPVHGFRFAVLTTDHSSPQIHGVWILLKPTVASTAWMFRGGQFGQDRRVEAGFEVEIEHEILGEVVVAGAVGLREVVAQDDGLRGRAGRPWCHEITLSFAP